MHFTTFITAAFLSTTIFAASIPPNPQNDLSSILAALRENNPDDAEAAATAAKVKLRHRRAVAAPQNDITSILAALEANSPEDAAAAKQVAGSGGEVGKRAMHVEMQDVEV